MTKDEILALNNIGLFEAVSHVLMQHPKDVVWKTSDTVDRIIGFMETQDVPFELSNVIPNSDPIVYECSFWGINGRSYACEDTIPLAVQRSFVLYMNDCFETYVPDLTSDIASDKPENHPTIEPDDFIRAWRADHTFGDGIKNE
jgi:hypothetical protein